MRACDIGEDQGRGDREGKTCKGTRVNVLAKSVVCSQSCHTRVYRVWIVRFVQCDMYGAV